MFFFSKYRKLGVFIVEFEQISYIILVFLLLTLTKQIPNGNCIFGPTGSFTHYSSQNQSKTSVFLASKVLIIYQGCITEVHNECSLEGFPNFLLNYFQELQEIFIYNKVGDFLSLRPQFRKDFKKCEQIFVADFDSDRCRKRNIAWLTKKNTTRLVNTIVPALLLQTLNIKLSAGYSP